MAPPSSSEKEWPVRLYRFTESDGWQRQEGAKVAAAPRQDCIVIPAMRQKFSLVRQKSCVIRRGLCILLVSQRRTRAMVLQFDSLPECLEFSDRFVELNPVLSVAETKGDGENPAGTPCIEAEISEQKQIVSYVARLLHDPDFLGFVEKLETYMSNTTDGAKILEGLGRQSLTLQNGE